MNRVRLEILLQGDEYRGLDLNESTSFEFNLRFGDLTNPTTTKVPFSIQLNLPTSDNNNLIFTHIWRLDHNVQSFNPLKRVPFRLYINDNLYEIGYIKLETIDKTYNIRLFGGLGDFFYTMSNIKIRDLDWQDLEHYVNNKQVYNSLNGGSLLSTNDKDIGRHLKYVLTYQGKYDGFDNKSIATTGKNGEDIIEEVKWEHNNKTFQSVDLKEHHRTGKINGISYFGEYRSYYQRPAVKLTTIFDKILARMLKEGWKTNLDTSFFNRSNPYWDDVWVIKKQYKVDDNNSVGVNVEIPNINSTQDIEGKGYNYSGKYTASSKGGFELRQGQGDKVFVTMPLNVSKSGWDSSNPIDIKAEVPFRMLVTMPKGNPNPKNKPMKKRADNFNMYVKCFVQHTNKNNGAVSKVYLSDNDAEYYNQTIKLNDAGDNNNRVDGMSPNYNEDTKDRTQYYISSERGTQEFGFIGSGTIDKSKLAPKAEDNRFELVFEVWGTTWWRRRTHSWSINFGSRIDLLSGTKVELSRKTEDNATRSSRLIKAENIFQDDKNCFEFVSSYCKMFGLMFEKDPVRKQVNILTRTTFFQGLHTVDWSYKMDRKEPYELTPVPFEYRYGVFKYNNKDTKFEKDYLDKNDRDFGSLVFDNGLEFTDTRKDYIEKMLFDNGIIVNEKSQYYLGRSKDLLADNKSLFHFEDGSGSKVDADYVLAFFNGREELKKPILITDDTYDMLVNGYCWTDRPDASLVSYKYNSFTREIGSKNRIYSLKFGRPHLAYHPDDLIASQSSPFIGSETIYRRFWADFISGRFDKNNKLLKAKFNVTNTDLRDIFRKFVKIDDTLWVVDEVNNFNPITDGLTDVVLVKVKDPNNFVKQDLELPELIIRNSRDEVVYDYKAGIGLDPLWIMSDVGNTTSISIESDTDWEIKPVSMKADPMSGGSGVTDLTITNPTLFPWSSATLSFNNGISNIGIAVYKRDFVPDNTSKNTAKLNRSWINEENIIR